MTKRLIPGMRNAGYLLVVSGLLVAPFVAVAQEEYAAPTAREKKAAADAALWNKNPAPTDPRDFSGVWWTRGYDRTFRPVTDPPLSPDEAAKLLPLTPAEALLNDLPVVLTDIAPFRELYGDWALFARAGQAIAFGKAMLSAIHNGPREGQSDSVRDRFSWRRNAGELVTVLADAAVAPRPGWAGAIHRIRWEKLPVLLRVMVGSKPGRDSTRICQAQGD